MKKLISILTAVTLVTSTTATIVACTTSKEKVTLYNENHFNVMLEQIAKAKFLSEEENYDFDYILSKIIKDEQMVSLTDTKIDNENSLNQFNRYYEYQNKYFDKNFISKKVKVNNEKSIKPSDKNIIMNLSQIAPQFIDILSNGNILELVFYSLDLVLNKMPEIISDLAILDYAEVFLSDANIKVLVNAFNNDKYDGYTMQEALDSSMIDLTNGLNKILKIKKTYKNGTKQEVKNWKSLALFGLEEAIRELSNQQNLNLDLVDNFEVVGSILNFIRILAIYFNNFAEQRNEALIQSKQSNMLNWKELESIRNTSYSEISNKVDFKNLFKYFNHIFKEETSGNELRNLLNFMFWGTQTYTKPVSLLPPSINIDGFIENFTNKDYKETGLAGVFKAILNGSSEKAMPLGGILTGVLGILGSGYQLVPGFMETPLITAIKVFIKTSGLDASMKDKINNLLKIENLFSDTWSALWDKNVIGALIGNSDLSLNKIIHKTKLSELLNSDTLMGFKLNDLTFSTLIGRMNKIVQNSTIEVSFKIDFNKFSALLNELIGVISIAKHNPSILVEKLGYKDKQIVKNSFIDLLKAIMEDLKGANPLFEQIDKRTVEFNLEQIGLANKISNDFYNLKVKEYKVENEKQYIYSFNDMFILIEIETYNSKYIISDIKKMEN